MYWWDLKWIFLFNAVIKKMQISVFDLISKNFILKNCVYYSTLTFYKVSFYTVFLLSLLLRIQNIRKAMVINSSAVPVCGATPLNFITGINSFF